MQTTAYRAIIALAVLVAMSLPAQAGAATTEQTIPAKVVFEHAATGPSSCSAVVFVEWKDEPGRWKDGPGEAVRATAFYSTTRGEESMSKARPFDDVYGRGTFRAPSGHHRIWIGSTSRAHLDGRTPQDCKDFDAKHKQIFNDQDPYVKVTIGAPQLTVSVRSTKGGLTQPDVDSTLTVSVTNTGSIPVEDIHVDSNTVIKVIKRACPGAVLRLGELKNGSQGTLAPGKTGSPYAQFDVTHVCAGSAKVTVTARGRSADGAEFTGRGTARVTVPETARIRGKVGLVSAWRGQPFGSPQLDPNEVVSLLRGLTVQAKGPKRTLRAEVSPIYGTYEIEVPRGALGRYVVTTSGPKATELLPARSVVNVGAGRTVVRDYEAGYSCEKKLPDGLFARQGGGPRGGYRCRSRRMLLYVEVSPDRTVEHGGATNMSTDCTRADGSTYEKSSLDGFVPVLLTRGTDGVLRGRNDYWDFSVTASVLTPDSIKVHISSTDCFDAQDYVLERLS